MGTHVGFRVKAGVRVTEQINGPRSPFGSLLEIDGIDPIGVAADELKQWRALAGGGRQPADDTPPSAWTGERAQLDRLLTTHHTPVSRTVRPLLPPPTPIRTHDVRVELRKRYVSDIALWRLRAFINARRDADRAVADEVARRAAEQTAQHDKLQAEADRWWEHLQAAEPHTAMDQLAFTFGRDKIPAACTAVANGIAYVIAAIDTPETLIGRHEPSTRNGHPFPIALISERRRNKYYAQAISSLVLATAADAFAVVGGLNFVTVAVVGVHRPPRPGVLALVELPRSAVLPDDAERPPLDDVFLAAGNNRIAVSAAIDDESDALVPLDVTEPAVATALNALERK